MAAKAMEACSCCGAQNVFSSFRQEGEWGVGSWSLGCTSPGESKRPLSFGE